MDRANGAGSGGAAASRAERFEDEKRRIIESCFSKKDTDGSLIETYITHIRIVEYSSHPTSPPPPQSRTPDAEKPRVIIVAVRKSGRVRMHKSKENANGTFSIGKTWNLDDLSHIESFTGPQVDPNQKEWAGDVGFIVTLGKQYYWQAQTDKEKKFFIASLVKIYGKYTGGKLPELNGFDQKEQDQVLGASRRPGAPPPRPSMPESLSSIPSAVSSPPPMARQTTPEAPRLPKGPSPRPPLNGGNSPGTSFDSSVSRDRRQAPWTSQSNKSQDSFATARSEDASSLPPRSRNGMAGPGALGRFGDSRDATDPPPNLPPPPPPTLPQQSQEGVPPPERRRPPMDPSRPQDRDVVPQPLMSPTQKREPVFPPPRSVERSPQKGAGSGASTPRERDPSPEMRRAGEGSVSSSVPPSAKSDAESLRSVQSPTDEPPMSPESAEEEARPGLGPMIKSKKSKGDIAGVLWKAANAASAFRPRPGGAAERLRLAQGKTGDGPDGITGVVPAPPRPVSRDNQPATPEVQAPSTPTGPPPSQPPQVPVPPAPEPVVPEVKVTESQPPGTPQAQPKELPKDQPKGPENEQPKDAKSKKAEPSKDAPSRSVVAGNDSKYLQALGIEGSLLDGRSQEFGKWLDFFGWVPGEQMRSRNADELKIDIDRELNKAQAGGWLARFREEDERVDAIKKGVDLAMTECDEMDNLLTLYSVELSTLSEDIAYIEAQGQGLQVQTANQKLLKKELESLLETCAITSNDLEALRLAPLDNMRGLEDVESSLVILYRAMSKIDPTLGEGELADGANAPFDPEQSLGLNSDYGKMRIVQEKKQMYMQESGHFMRRLVEFMARQFDEAYNETKRALDGALSKKVDATHHNAGRDILWKYSPLMLYARDADLDNWNRLIQIYQDKSHPLYKSEFQNVITIWRKNAKKMTGEESELLFTSQVEKQQEGVATTARKLTVKRSQTLARALRSPLADGGARVNTEKATGERSMPYEVFLGVLDDLLPLVEMEQNFVTDFFHASTLEQGDFPDSVATIGPRNRRGGDLKRHRLMEPDRELARRVTRSMEVIFSFLEVELQRLMEWVVAQDPLQGVGVFATLEKKLSEISQSNQDYLNTMLQQLHDALEVRFTKFVDEQIRAIEETKVKINKRKGVISFFRVFPHFLTACENMIAGADPHMPLRRTIDREYDRILKSMFDSLMVIAREHPVGGVATSSNDPDGKEALNFHVLLIENMNHFLEETEPKGLEVLEEWKEQANAEYHEHMDLYLGAIMRRPLGKLLDHLENIETQIQAGKSPTAIARQPSNSKAVFTKVVSVYDSKEVRKGIEALRKRVEKHFGDADDPALSRGLVAKVLAECEAFYGKVEVRIGRVTTDAYGGDVPFEWPRADVKAAFR